MKLNNKYRLAILFCLLPGLSFSQEKKKKNDPTRYKEIDSSAIANWRILGSTCGLSANGKFCYYMIANQPKGKTTLIVKSLSRNWSRTFLGVDESSPFFSENSRKLLFVVNDTLKTLILDSDSIQSKFGIRDLKIPISRGRWLTYRLNEKMDDLIVDDVISDQKLLYKASDFYIDPRGKVLLMLTSDNANGYRLLWHDLTTGVDKFIWSTKKKTLSVKDFNFDKNSEQLVFTSSDSSGNEIWYYNSRNSIAELKVSKNFKFSRDYIIKGNAKFSFNCRWILFEFMPRPDNFRKLIGNVMVDIWSYKDLVLQPQQMVNQSRIKDDLKFKGAVSTIKDDVIRLEMFDEEVVTDADKITGDYVVVKTHKSIQENWQSSILRPSFYLMSLLDGKRMLIDQNLKINSIFSFSPTGAHLLYWNMISGHFYSFNTNSHKVLNLTKNIRTKFYKNYEQSVYKLPVSTVAGWSECGTMTYLYDNFDIWRVNLNGNDKPLNVTNFYGKNHSVKLRFVYGQENYLIKDSLQFLLTGFNSQSKYNGFFRLITGPKPKIEQLYSGPFTFYKVDSQKDHEHFFDNGIKPVKASNADCWILTRQTASEAPNLFLTTDFRHFNRITNITPESQYNWLETELVSWKMFDGNRSQGILYKPYNFDPNRKYPIIFHYYQAFSHELYEYPKPNFILGDIDIPWFVSRGYLVFTCDVHFSPKKRTPGESTYNSVVSAAHHLMKKYPFINRKCMGIQGHSFGGEQTNYLLIKSRLFSAAFESAGYTDPVSGYLSLSPFNRLQIENSSSIDKYEERYGYGNLWLNTKRYLKNSTVLNAHKINTPLLIMHSAKDNQIPWRQGVELFIALRRLKKKVWMLQYDNGSHLVHLPQDAFDLTVRATEFFDHFLKKKPAARWMTQGVPYALKGIETRYSYDLGGRCGNNCQICKEWNSLYLNDPESFDRATLEWSKF